MKQTFEKPDNPAKEESNTSKTNSVSRPYVSLVTQAGVVMSIIVGLALLSMMTSMFVSEGLDGDAAQINIAGSLRMQSVRLSRALMAQENQLEVANNADVTAEVAEFERRFKQLETGLGARLSNSNISPTHTAITAQWSLITKTINTSPKKFSATYGMIDQFIANIEQLVKTLQHQSESKIRTLRIIQSSSMFLILLTAFLSLQRMTRMIVQPMNQLVLAASEAARGNFSVRAYGKPNTEIGVLARTFNNMSEQLQAMHDRFEQRVQEKTSKLEQSNRSLELLYQTSHNLVRPQKNKDYQTLLQKIEENLGHGELTLCLNDKQTRDSMNSMSPISNHELPTLCNKINRGCDICLQENGVERSFNIKKREKEFGRLRYADKDGIDLELWQSHLLQTIADNIAVAISLDKKRQQENLIGLQEERAVIARELHDSLAQSLSYLKLQTALLSKQLDNSVPRDRVDTTIGDIREGLSDAYRHLRELLTTFRLQIGDASLETALSTTAIEFSQKCAHPVTLDCAIDTTRLSANEQIHVLQIVREALSNIQRHAQASEARIVLSQQHDNTYVEVSDNGIGLQTVTDTDSHYGISIMQERAGSLNTCLEISSPPQGGTSVKLKFVSNMSPAPKPNNIEQVITL